MKDLTFSVRFHQPFLVRSGGAVDGLDGVARKDCPLPASSVKGAMRAAAENVLGLDQQLAARIFGQPAATLGAKGSGAWAWTDPGPVDAFACQARARNRIDHRTGIARPEALTYSEEWWQRADADVSFTVEQLQPVDSADIEQHVVALCAAAYAVTGLGSWRNRGMGAVTIRPIEAVGDLASRWRGVAR